MTEPFQTLIDYTPYAVEFRYEGLDSDAEPIDRESALALVAALLEQVRRELSEGSGNVTDWPRVRA